MIYFFKSYSITYFGDDENKSHADPEYRAMKPGLENLLIDGFCPAFVQNIFLTWEFSYVLLERNLFKLLLEIE